MNAPRSWPSQSPFSAGPECKCPRSGQGRLFANLLDVRDRCGPCGLDLTPHGTGDGATVFFILFLRVIVVGLAIWLELAVELAAWVHLAVGLLVIGSALWRCHVPPSLPYSRCIKKTCGTNTRPAMMPERVPFRLNFWMTACAIPVLMLLIGLGVWQLQRLEWKQALIAERADRGAAAPLAITEVPDDGWKDLEYRRVTLRGRFLHDREMLILNKVCHGQTGFDLVTPMELADGGAVLIHRGWVPVPGLPEILSNAAHKGSSRSPECCEMAARPLLGCRTTIRQPISGFSPTWRRWPKHRVLPVKDPILFALLPILAKRAIPRGRMPATKLVTNTLEYAITWFGLAATLVMIYLAYHVRRR